MRKTLLKGGHVITVDGPERPDTDVLVADGVITAIGPGLPELDATVVDASGYVVTPGLVDAHRHVWQAPLRGLGVDMPMSRYLPEVLGAALPGYTAADAGRATLLGAVEALDAGVTTVFDWSNATLTPAHTDAVVDAFERSGIRAVVGHGNAVDEADVRRLAARTGRVTGALAILGGEYGDWDEAVAQIRLGRELGVVVSMHAGGPVVRRLHDAGLLGPDLQLVHLNAIPADDVKLLVAAGAAVVVTPTVEAVMGHGPSAYGRLADGGGRPALGVDVVINATPDLFEPMRDTLRTERLRAGSAAAPPAATMLRAATIDGARAVGLADSIGTITVGKRADLLLLDGLANLTGERAGAVVSCLTPANVRTVLVDGHLVKHEGRLLHHDLSALR
ncbi:amidohydrolase family protein [Micromonospora sp. NPDC050276]|uniref:amidohydrolase family protein n=1 Tax=Micromonospora sp. NPDC050276 TaxID=3364278 RepID=UPI00379A29D5